MIGGVVGSASTRVHGLASKAYTTRTMLLLRAHVKGLGALALSASLGLVAPAGCGSSSNGDHGCSGGNCGPGDGGSTPDAAADAAGEANADAGHDAEGGSSPASCTFDGQTVAPGASVTAYQSTTVPAGSVCVSQSRTCTNGTLSGTYTSASCSVTLVPAFYVSPTGSDKNPGTLAAPFLTLTQAQSAMKASATIKTTYVRAGTYALTAISGTSSCDGGTGTTAIDLAAADAGETWSYYPPDGFGTAVIDGGSTSTTTGVACAFAASSAPNLTFIGLQFQHLQYSAIWANSSSGLTVSDNTIHDLTVAVYNVGGVAVHSSSGVTVKNNFIHDVAYMGIGAWGGSMSNTAISGNVVLSSCTAAANPGGNDMDGGDCGAIYTGTTPTRRRTSPSRTTTSAT